MAGAKLADAQAAALTFVGLMDLAAGQDRVAVLRFDSSAELLQGLTRDRARVEAAIRGLGTREGTYMDRGLAAAGAELSGAGQDPDKERVVILLTDGQQTGGPAAALAEAAALRAAGVGLYTIGLGPDVDGSTLVAMAGLPGRYRHVPDSAELAAIYAEVAGEIQCPAASLWPSATGSAPSAGPARRAAAMCGSRECRRCRVHVGPAARGESAFELDRQTAQPRPLLGTDRRRPSSRSVGRCQRRRFARLSDHDAYALDKPLLPPGAAARRRVASG
jgi:hypothetical protein